MFQSIPTMLCPLFPVENIFMKISLPLQGSSGRVVRVRKGVVLKKWEELCGGKFEGGRGWGRGGGCFIDLEMFNRLCLLSKGSGFFCTLDSLIARFFNNLWRKRRWQWDAMVQAGMHHSGGHLHFLCPNWILTKHEVRGRGYCAMLCSWEGEVVAEAWKPLCWMMLSFSIPFMFS